MKDTMAEIMKSKKGEHNILVYPDADSLRTIYAQMCKSILEDDGIVVLLTYYEPISRVFAELANVGIDVDAYRKKGYLIVADAVEEFFGRQKDFLLFLLNVERKLAQLGKSYVSVVL